MKSIWLGLLISLTPATRAWAQALPTELEDCTGSGSRFCYAGTATVIDSSCGARFDVFSGRIAWPPLKYVGPVTIAVQTRDVGGFGATLFPLYVEVAGRLPTEGTDCVTGLGGAVVLVAEGADQCGGTWESIGPLDLTHYGVPLGANYDVQCVFFQTTPGETIRSVGFACIRVTTMPQSTTGLDWGSVKARDQ